MARLAATTATLLTLGAAVLGFHPEAQAQDVRMPFHIDELEPLLQSLQDEGLPRPALNDIFYDPRLRKTSHAVTLNSVNPDGADRYEQFYTRWAVNRAKSFKRRHFGTLERAEQEYGVPANIIVGVLLVETQFGTYPLRYKVVDVYTTLVVDANFDAIDRHYERIKDEYPEVDRNYFAERVRTKAEWAYDELIALLSLAELDPNRVFDMKGSYAGAFGMPQFLPTSYLRWAVDGNGDGEVDLDDTADAIASIANYLHAHGWRQGAGLEEKMRAVWLYNRSPHYVNAVFEISRRMTLPPRKSLPRESASNDPAGSQNAG